MTGGTKESRIVLITGCSDGGMGAALAEALHKAGLTVYATARDPAKMKSLSSLEIVTLQLDVESETSIAACVKQVPELDILINNAGQNFLMPVADISIAEAKKIYDINVWAHIAVTQAFLPLLLKSKGPGMIVNQTSIGGVSTIPFRAVYHSAKAAFIMISDTMRLELQPFGIKVIDLRTGLIKTNLIGNIQQTKRTELPKGSIFEPARDLVERELTQKDHEEEGTDPSEWAQSVVGELLKPNPSPVIWKGEKALLSRIAAVAPFGTFDGFVRKLSGFDKVEQRLREQETG
ncbi:hypothetical protein INS49_005374 [Diaporthe citri]|uniref:uncharacterized protein n=1 Tax=Diaporthe citri TaxID=83186 RepID=UPI001C800566|nr:uncharacterized protein INS49_005374 [Diaporthe citri]KAG6353666.1 hypothetical protein INS49_005374 [Diaporthe citri]